jgi:hypothetical protein
MMGFNRTVPLPPAPPYDDGDALSPPRRMPARRRDEEGVGGCVGEVGAKDSLGKPVFSARGSVMDVTRYLRDNGLMSSCENLISRSRGAGFSAVDLFLEAGQGRPDGSSIRTDAVFKKDVWLSVVHDCRTVDAVARVAWVLPAGRDKLRPKPGYLPVGIINLFSVRRKKAERGVGLLCLKRLITAADRIGLSLAVHIGDSQVGAIEDLIECGFESAAPTSRVLALMDIGAGGTVMRRGAVG